MIATIHAWRDRVVFTSPKLSSGTSCRPAMVILVSAHSEVCLTAGGMEYRGRAFLIGPNVERSVAADDARHYSLILDPTHRICRYLRNKTLCELDVLDISGRVDAHVRALISAAVNNRQDCAEAYRISQQILNSIFPETVGAPPIDLRVELVASWLFAHVPTCIDLAFLADLCGLSQNRLSHIFTTELGISLRQYLLWVKMRRAAEMFANKRSLAEVAHEIAFSDSAHLSRTYMRYFGLTPSYLSNSKLVRIHLCEC